jgi:flagellar protein FliL
MSEVQESRGGKSGGGSKKLVIILVVLLLGAGGAVGWLFLRKSAPPAAGGHAAEGAAAVEKNAKALYLALEPAFVVNFKSTGGNRFLQVGVQLMAQEQAALDAAKANEPALRDALIMLFSSQDSSVLATREGKEQLRLDALAAVRKVLEGRSGGKPVDAVYFTAFVMQ